VDDGFLTLAAAAEAVVRVRGSVFHSHAAPASTSAEARERIDAWSRPRHDATHHCTAWRLRDGAWRADDDGEPSGSAGAPILAAIDGAGLVDVLVVVTRYYGGTKLGVGGLVRTYGEAAALALETAARRVGVPAACLSLEHDYAHTSAVMRALEQLGASSVEHGYTDAGSRASLSFVLPRANVDALQIRLREATAGEVAASVLQQTVRYRPAPTGR
jgi:uncharacterized YigZ family protein